MSSSSDREAASQPPGVRALALSSCIAEIVAGAPRRGVVHSVFAAAANIVFPGAGVLSLNAHTAPRLPNGLELSVAAGAFPFSALRPGIQALLGAERLHIEAVNCSLDLSFCERWDPYIQRPADLDEALLARNTLRLAGLASAREATLDLAAIPLEEPDAMVRYLCGRGPGLTPAGDDLLAGWLAGGWLLRAGDGRFQDTCRLVVEVAERQTHLLSRAWLGYAAQGAFALPIVELLAALCVEDHERLERAAAAVLTLGATSGHDLVQGVLLGLHP